MSGRRYVLFGYLGARNFGDDMMLLGLVSTLAERSVDLTILARDPDNVVLLETPNATVQVKPANARVLLSLLRPRTVFVRVGGTSFHDEYEDRSMVSTYLKLAAIFWVPGRIGGASAALGIGAGRIKRSSTRILARAAMGAAQTVLVRDPQSGHAIRDLAPRANVVDGLDLATMLTMPDVTRQAGTLGISVLDLDPYVDDATNQRAFWQATIQTLLDITADTKHLRLFVFKDNDSESDRPVSEDLVGDLKDLLDARGISTEIIVASDHPPQEILRSIAECAGFLATRYHAALLAAQANVPLAIVQYNAKLGYLADDYQLAQSSVIDPMTNPSRALTLSQPRPSSTALARREATLSAIEALFGKE